MDNTETRKTRFFAVKILVAGCAVLLTLVGCRSEKPASYAGYELDWSDDFNRGTLDKTIWRHAVGGGGYGNNEMQYYTNTEKNARVEGGLLILEAHRERKAGWPYTSAKLQPSSAV